jgi:hypothetical protein
MKSGEKPVSEKNKMKIEKKLIAAIALAITIGIATVIPLTFFMDNTAKAQTSVTASLFNIDIPCAYYNANVTYDVKINSLIDGSHRVHDIWYRDGAVIAVQPSINYDVLDNNTVARIEFFEYTVYTDKLQLQKSYSYFAFNESAFGRVDTPHGSSSFIVEYYINNIRNKNRGSDTFGGEDVTGPDRKSVV